MPAKAGIHVTRLNMGPRFREDDDDWCAVSVSCFLLPVSCFLPAAAPAFCCLPSAPCPVYAPAPTRSIAPSRLVSPRSLQMRKQRHSNSVAARIWSGNPKQSAQRSSRARQAQSQEKSKLRILPLPSTSTTPVKSEQPEVPETRTASISSVGSLAMS